MKRIILSLLIVVSVLSLFATNFPSLSGRVVDDANIFNRNEENQLNSYLIGLQKDSGIEAVVVSVKSLGGNEIADYTIRLAEKWKIGRKDKDNGLIFLIAPNDRQLRVEVGYGLEPTLTDGVCSYIIRNDIIPEIRGGGYYEGVVAGLTSLNNVATGKTQITKAQMQRSRKKKSKGSTFGYIIFLIIISSLFRGRLFPLLFLGGMMGGNHRGGGGSGGFGGGGFSGGGGGFGGGGASGSW